MSQIAKHNHRNDCHSNYNHFGISTGSGYLHYGGAGTNGKPYQRKNSYNVENAFSKSTSSMYGAFEFNEYEVYDRRSPATKGNRGGQRAKQTQNNELPEDVFYNPDKNMIYVKKGEECSTSINLLELHLRRSASQKGDQDRLSSYSTNSSDEDSAAKQKPNPEFIEVNSPAKCKRWRFGAFEVYFNEKKVAVYGPTKNEKRKKKATADQSYMYSPIKFGGSEMKNGPMNLESIPVPSFAL